MNNQQQQQQEKIKNKGEELTCSDRDNACICGNDMPDDESAGKLDDDGEGRGKSTTVVGLGNNAASRDFNRDVNDASDDINGDDEVEEDDDEVEE